MADAAHHGPPAPSPPASWEAVDAPKVWPRSDFLQPESRGDRTRVAYFLEPHTNRLCAQAWFGPGAEGGPGIAHGGALAAVLDEVMGFCAWYNGHPVVTGSLTIHYRQSVPVGTETNVETWVQEVVGRKVYTKGRMYSTGDGAVTYAESEAVFIVLRDEHFEEMLKRLSKSNVHPEHPV